MTESTTFRKTSSGNAKRTVTSSSSAGPATRKRTIASGTPSQKRKIAPGAKKKKKMHRVLGTKLWTLKRADSAFSQIIRNRDGMCLFPGCGTTLQLTCSHYFGRVIKSTRFYEDNCITLCRTHHYWDKDLGWEFQKQRKGHKGCDWDGRYTVFMKEWLGEERWNRLTTLAGKPISQRKAIEDFMESYPLTNLDKVSEHETIRV